MTKSPVEPFRRVNAFRRPLWPRKSASAISLCGRRLANCKAKALLLTVLTRGAFVKGADRPELVDLIEVRTLLESSAAASAARNAGSEQLKELDDRWHDLAKAAEGFNVPAGTDIQEALRKWLVADLEFHMTLLRLAGNRRVIRIIQDMRVMTYMFGYRTGDPAVWSDPAAFGARNLRDHREIYEAVRMRDPKAAKRAMAVHLRRAGKNLLCRYDRLVRGEIVIDDQTQQSELSHNALGLATHANESASFEQPIGAYPTQPLSNATTAEDTHTPTS